MQVKYRLDPEVASYGSTLWNNLVVGNKCSTLDYAHPEFKRLTPREQMQGACDFQYEDIAKVRVTAPNDIQIEVETGEQLREVESHLKAICKQKGVPLIVA